MAKKTKRKAPARVGDHINGMVPERGGVGLGDPVIAVVHLRPWTDATGKVHRRELRVEIPTKSLDAAYALLERWHGKAVGLTVTKAWAERGHSAEGVRTDRLRSSKLDVKIEPEHPVVVQDRSLGVVELDRGLPALVGLRSTSRYDYEVLIDAPATVKDGDARRRVQNARKKILGIEDAMPELRNACADELLDLHNDRWNDGPPTTRSAFKRALSIASVHVQSRRTTVYLSAGELFGDHGVEIRLSARGVVREILVS